MNKIFIKNNDILAEIQEALVSGSDVELEGIGILSPRYRKVKNSYGRDYSIVIKLIQNKGMKKMLLKSYKENPDKFNK